MCDNNKKVNRPPLAGDAMSILMKNDVSIDNDERRGGITLKVSWSMRRANMWCVHWIRFSIHDTTPTRSHFASKHIFTMQLIAGNTFFYDPVFLRSNKIWMEKEFKWKNYRMSDGKCKCANGAALFIIRCLSYIVHTTYVYPNYSYSRASPNFGSCSANWQGTFGSLAGWNGKLVRRTKKCDRRYGLDGWS